MDERPLNARYRAVLLDRDGVIIENRSPYVLSWADVSIYPQALTALAHLHPLVEKVLVVTNQACVGKGMISLAEAEAINERLQAEVVAANGRYTATYLCPHTPDDLCVCRKPQPGLLWQAAHEYKVDLSEAVFMGDALTDLQAGQAAGVGQLVLLRTGRGRQQEQLPGIAEIPGLLVFEDLLTAVNALFCNNHVGSNRETV